MGVQKDMGSSVKESRAFCPYNNSRWGRQVVEPAIWSSETNVSFAALLCLKIFNHCQSPRFPKGKDVAPTI